MNKPNNDIKVLDNKYVVNIKNILGNVKFNKQ